jgi:hypothetical protein
VRESRTPGSVRGGTGRLVSLPRQPHLNEQWVIPPDANAAFVAAMEDVIEVYHRPHDPDRPVVCVDETSKELIIETCTPIPAKPGQPRRVDYEYERNGTANLFMMAFRRGFSRTARNAIMMFAPP